MASAQDLSDQLTLTTKLAAQVERMAAAAEKLDASYQGQIDAVTKLTAVFNTLNTAGTVQGIEVLNKSLKDMQDKMKDTGKASESAFTKLGKKIEDTGKTISQKFPKSVAIGLGALSGFAQGVSNIIALGKGVTSFFESFIDGIVNLGASIIAIPFKIFSGLVDMAAKSAGGSNELMQAIESLRKEFGLLGGPTNKTIIDMTTSLKGFSDTGLSAWRVFGNMAQRLETFHKLATEMGATFVTLRKEFEANGGALLAYQKGLGISDEQMKGVASRAISMGTTLGDTLKEMTKDSTELGKAFGLDAKVLSRDVAKAMVDVKHFAGATTKAITEAATYARKLGLELDKITGTLDAFETFDTAAENVAKLSQAFGVQADAFQLMEAQDPASQVDILRKSFAAAGVDASTFNRQQLKLLASTTGLDEATAKQAFSMKNQGVSLDQIKKKGSEAEKKTLTQAQAMEKLAGAIERLTQSGGGMEGGFWDMFVKGIKNGIMSSKEFFGLMRNIQRALQQVYMVGVKLGRELVNIVPGFKDILGNLKDFFDPKKFVKLFQGISDSVKKFFDPKSEDKGSIPKLVEHLQDVFTNMFTAEGSAGKKILEGFKKLLKMLSETAAAGIKYLIPQLTEGFKTVTEFLKNPKQFLAAVKGGAKSGSSFMFEILDPLIKAVNDPVMWEGLWDAFKGFAGEFWNLLWNKAIKPLLASVPAWFWAAVAGVIFGPAMTQALFGLGVKLIGDALLKVFFKSATQLAAEKAAAGILAKATATTVESGVEAGAKAAGPAAATGLWSNLISFITTVPTGVAAAGAIALGASLAAIGVAAVAAFSIWDAKGMQEKAAKDYTDGMSQVTNALSKLAPVEEKKRALVLREAQIKAQEDALKDKKSGVFSGVMDSFREAWEVALNKTHTTTEDMIAKMKRDRDDLNAQVSKINDAAAKKAENDSSKKRLLDAMGPITVENAADRFKKVGDLAKKLMGKDFDIGGQMDMIRTKLESVNFTLFGNKDKEDQINQTLSTLESVKALLGVIADVGILSAKAKDSLVKSASLKDSIEGFSTLVASVGVAVGAGDNSLKSRLEVLSPSIDVISKDASKFTDLGDAFKNISQAASVYKEMLASVTQVTGDKSLKSHLEVLASSIDVISNIAVTPGVNKLSGIGNMFQDISQVALDYKEMSSTVTAATAHIGAKGINPALGAVQKMVKVANDLNAALSDGNLNKIDIKAKLANVAKAVGLGGSASYTVNPSKQVQITLNIEVTMDVDKVEKVMILRKQSIISDRIDFATSNNVGKRVSAPLSSYTPESPPPVPAAGGGTQ